MGCIKSKEIEDMASDKKSVMPVMKSTSMLGNSLKNYEIKSILHKGRNSNILQVKNKVSKVPYAVRVFDINNFDHWKDEIFILRRVKHDNIIKLFEIFNQKDKKFLVMELASAGNLADLLKSNIIFKTEHEIALIVRKILGAVYYLHLLGITHRDLNPKNILFTHRPSSKLMLSNFRSCCYAHPTSVMNGKFGLAEYSAPEMSDGNYTNLVDIWSVGVIMYELYFRSLPNIDNFAHMSNLKDYSRHTLTFISSLLNRDPLERFSAQQALTSKYIRNVSVKPKEHNTPRDSTSSSITNSVSKSSASWRVSVYSN